MAKNLLLPWEQYKEKAASVDIPYIYTISNKRGQFLTYFGARHTYDPFDKQIPKLKDTWSKFIGHTKGKIPVVFVEGGKRKIFANEEEAITKEAEAGLITFLATQEGIEIYSPDLSWGSAFNDLVKQFPKEQILYFRVAQIATQWNRLLIKGEFNEYLNSFLKRYQKDFELTDADCSFENIKDIHQRLFHNDFDENNKDFFNRISAPIYQDSIINEISRTDSNLRNIRIIEQVKQYWNEGRNIFIVFGFGHAIIQEPALRVLLV